MKLAVAGDSAGNSLASQLVEYLKDKHEVTELSKPENGGDKFYANLSDRVGSAVIRGDYDRAVLVCGTGIGVCIAANKVSGVRAALCHDTYSAERAVLSNNAQILTMGARVIGAEVAKTIADAFLAVTFDQNGRSASNVAAINAVDDRYKS